jgi:hypothetical protein
MAELIRTTRVASSSRLFAARLNSTELDSHSLRLAISRAIAGP